MPKVEETFTEIEEQIEKAYAEAYDNMVSQALEAGLTPSEAKEEADRKYTVLINDLNSWNGDNDDAYLMEDISLD